MKIKQAFAVAAVTGVFLVLNAKGQTFQYLGPVAAQYDILGLTIGADSSKLDISEGSFNGLIGADNIDEVKIRDASKTTIDGSARFHSGVGKIEYDAAGTAVPAFSGFNTELNAADNAISSYISYLNSLTATSNFGSINQNNINATSMGMVNVLDFADADWKDNTVTLNGSAGGDDIFVLRFSDDVKFDNSSVVLNNLNRRNVFWVSNNDSKFDLHNNDGQSFEGVIFSESNAGDAVILGDVAFTGQVYAANLKIGTDIVFEGSSVSGPPVPEPSVSLLLIGSLGGLLLRRRR